MSRHTRVHYMDNLRAFAMLLGIFFHAALAYSPLLGEVWLTADPQQSKVVDLLAYFSHTFRMPLFFIIAGFFAAMMVQKRGIGGLIKNRLLRIGLPFALFFPLIIISFMVVIGWAIEHVQHPSPMLGFAKMMSQNPDAPAPPLTTTHLWFLYNLMFFYALAVMAVKWIKLDWMKTLSTSPFVFVLLAPLMLIPALSTQYLPIPAPEQFMPQLWSFGFYGLFFTLGWGLFSRPDFLDKLNPYSTIMLISGTFAYGVFYSLLPTEVNFQDVMIQASQTPELNAKQLLLAGLQAYAGLHVSLGLLLLGRRFFNRQSSAMRLIADSSYWIYIIHLPVLWAIQFLLLDTQWGLITEFLISSLGTLLIGMLSYLLIVRWTPIGWLLNGRKGRQNNEDAIEVKEPSTSLD